VTSDTASQATARAQDGSRTTAQHGFRIRDYGIVVAAAAIVVALSVSTNTFLTTSNIINLLDQCSVLGLLAAGATVCILSGVFDLTASASLALAAIVGVDVVRVAGIPLGFAAAVIVGAGLGFVTGTIVVRSGVNSFIATLAISIAYQGLAVAITASAIVYPLASQATRFGMLTWPSLFHLTSATVVFIVVVAILGVIVSATTFGRRVYAVGGNTEAARLSGIQVGQVRVAAYVISGICSALAGLILASRAGSANSSMATDMDFTAIAAAVIGGTSILGGEGAIWRGVVGAFLLTLIGNGFNLLGWNTTYQQIVEGCLILVAVSMDQRLRQRAS
jgi:ribose transport system permease protein